jgi:hypothetical protein
MNLYQNIDYRKGKHMRMKAISIIVSLLICAIHLQSQTTEPLKGWELNENNTGIAGAGLSTSTMTNYTGPTAVPAGTTIREKIITQILDLSAGNIAIERCYICPTTANWQPFVGGIVPAGSANAVRVSSCTIDGSGVTSDNDICETWAVCLNNAVIENCNIKNLGSGIWMGGSDPVRIENNYIHNLRCGVKNGEASHQDGFTVRSYSGPEMIISNNRIVAQGITCTGAFFLQATFGSYDNILIQGNLLEGNG